MDNLYNSESNKIPYDDTPIFRANKRIGLSGKGKKTKIFSVFFVLLFVMNIALCITCYTYLKNGKIKNVNIYNDTYSSQETSYLVDSMRSAKYHSVCVAAGIIRNGISILPEQVLTNDQFYGSTKSHGAGFLYKIIENTAYFVTCFHVINYTNNENDVASTRIWVLPATMLVPIEVELVSYSEKDDVAVLKYTHSNILETLEGCTPVSVYDSAFLKEYEDVFTIGNPLNHGLAGTNGKISAVRQLIRVSGMDIDSAWIKTNTPINPGNSGGGLYNAKGELIGMVNANIPKNASGEPVSNVAFAIPGALVCSIADYIIANNLKMSPPLAVDLGIEIGVDEIMGIERYKDVYKDQNGEYVDVDQQYVVVKSFTSSTSIAKNLLKVNDRILSVELKLYGKEETIVIPILNKYTFYEYAYGIEPGSVMKFVVQRQNLKNETITETVEVRATNRVFN